ncbi:MAG: allA [Myxococcaceae bacterium]|nr:allA [Myxococcaceae bacterium]
MAIVAKPLTAEAFAAFGEVVSVGNQGGTSANGGTAQRFDYTASLQSQRPGAKANMVTVSCVPVSLPLPLKLLEKHPHSSQTFIPMVCSRYLICVAPTARDGSPELSGLKAFIGEPGQAINYHPGIWHHPLVVLDSPAQFAMLVWEDGSTEDCVLFPLTQPQLVTG